MECDQAFAECKQKQFELLWKSKVDIAKNLDQESRKLCPSLKYFVGFSDVAVLFGVYGKTACAYVNSAMEMIYQKRKAQNYPAVRKTDQKNVYRTYLFDRQRVPNINGSLARQHPRGGRRKKEILGQS